MEYRQLIHLLAVADKGTIGKAAESLGISQPALTKSIRSLEKSLGVPLLDRRSRGAVPTAYGEAVIARARSVRLHISAMRGELETLEAGGGGTIKIGMAQGVASRLMPLATMRILAERPDIRVLATTGPVDQLAEALINGQIEFAVTPFGQKTFGPSIVEEFLFHDRPMVVVRPTHPLARHDELHPRQLKESSWILSGPTTPLRRAFDQIFAGESLAPPTPAIESDSVIFTKALLMETDLAGFFPQDEIRVEEDAELLSCIPVKTAVPARSVGILYRRGETLGRFAAELVEATKAVARDLGYMSSGRGKAR